MIRAGWNELLIAAFSFKSTHLNEDAIRLSDGTVIAKDEAHLAGIYIYKTAFNFPAWYLSSSYQTLDYVSAKYLIILQALEKFLIAW